MKPSKTVYLLGTLGVDPQKGFTPLCPNELPVPGGHEIVGALNEMRAFDSLNALSSDAHSRQALFYKPELPQFTPLKHQNVDTVFNMHCEAGTYGAELLDGLPQPIDVHYFVWKGIANDLHPYGACYHDLSETLTTGLIEFYNSYGVKSVIVGGLAFDFCVIASVRQLVKAGFDVAVYLPATRAISKAGYDATLLECEQLSVKLLSTADELSTFADSVLNPYKD